MYELSTASAWRRFPVTDLFDIDRGHSLTKKDMIAGDMPFVSSSKYENGISHYIKPPKDAEIFHPRTITISMKGSILALYHDQDYCASESVAVLKPKHEADLRKEQLIFIASILTVMIKDHSFYDSLNLEKVKRLSVPLPVYNNGDLDFGLMIEYTRKLQSLSDDEVNKYFYEIGWVL